MNVKNRPELLSPAGNPEKLRFAVAYGADAVYLAGRSFGMRGAAGNFSDAELVDAVRFAHGHGVRVYVACNTMPRSGELAALPAFLETAADAGADALIVSDLGVLSLARRYAPGVPLHVSTQACVVNDGSARMWHSLGARRIVLARELSLPEIAEIRAKTPADLELEAFVHGAMCVSYSGRCLISNALAERDANRGLCAQPCRWEYRLVEEKRPGEYMPVFEDERGTYLYNAKDLCMIGHLPELARAGIDSFKIEGRAKTAYYAAVVTGAYRRAIDGYLTDPENARCPDALYTEVERVSHRAYCTGFYFGPPRDGEYRKDARYIREWDAAAYVTSCTPDGDAVVTQKNRFAEGDRLELLTPDGCVTPFVAGALADADGRPVAAASHPLMQVRLRLPRAAPPCSFLRRACI